MHKHYMHKTINARAYYIFRGGDLLFLQKQNKKPKTRNFTLILVPGKYGSSKSFNISRWIIYSFAAINIIFFICIALFAFNYVKISNARKQYLLNIQSLESSNEEQNKELSELKKNAGEIKDKLTQLKELEGKLKERLGNKSLKGSSTESDSYVLSTQQLISSADSEIKSVNILLSVADRQIASYDQKPSIFPCYGSIESSFGRRRDPMGRGGYEYHDGIDIASRRGTPIRATASGIVEEAGWEGSFGKLVVINHNNGYKSYYGHNASIIVRKGQRVKKGQIIAYMGSTGRSTGPHCHFEITLNGIPVNPLKIIRGGN